MNIECVVRKNADKPIEILSEFLKKFAAVVKYGKTTIYEGDVYYIPYTLVEYKIQETQETYLFLGSLLAEDICVFKQDGHTGIDFSKIEADSDYVLRPLKNDSMVQEEVLRKIKLNKRMRKLYIKYHFEQTDLRMVYFPEQAFYVKGKSEWLLLVDPLLEKVDYKHLSAVEKRFAENFLKEQGSM